MDKTGIAQLHEVDAWSRDAAAALQFSPLSGSPFLLFEAQPCEAEASRAIGKWLRQLTCPTIAIAAADLDSDLVRACDTVVRDAAQAQPLIDTIRRNPIAATVFVQLLRLAETLSIGDAMQAESLAYSTLQAGPEFQRWLAQYQADEAAPTDAGPAVVLQREDDLLILELNRPSNRNAMSIEMRDALVEALQLALADDSIRRIRISGRGKCFSTGGDLAEFGSAPDAATAHIVRSLSVPGRLLAACASRTEVRVHGACVGSGIEFPAFAGRIVASGDTHFQLPELKFGLIPGAGGCVSLPRRIGRQRTAWLGLSGKRINAKTALEWGLIDAI